MFVRVRDGNLLARGGMLVDGVGDDAPAVFCPRAYAGRSVRASRTSGRYSSEEGILERISEESSGAESDATGCAACAKV